MNPRHELRTDQSGGDAPLAQGVEGDLLPLDPRRLSQSGGRFARSAMERLLAEESDAFVLHAATAVEHLAKAILAGVHPALVADNRSFDALLLATGCADLADPRKLRTVSGRDALERVKRFVPALQEVDES